MASPFPGMDPYLEVAPLWGELQQQFVAALHQGLAPTLADRYRAKVTTRKYATELVLFTSIRKEEQTEPYIEIRSRADNKLVTLIDIVSPVNKTTADGRAAYLDIRRDAFRHGANAVEIDLILDGRPTLDYSRDGLPEWDYAVTVTRATSPDRHEIYTATLQKPLPRFRLPLGADSRDVLIDLQATFAKAFESGHFGPRMDYGQDPAVPLEDSDRAWLRDLLKRHKLRA